MTNRDKSPRLIATYYVVPFKTPKDAGYQRCGYFTSEWMGITSNALNSRATGFDTDFVRLVQPTLKEMLDHGVDVSQVDADAKLFAGVAKTLGQNLALPNLFGVIDGQLILPVADRTQRGLVLIFTHAVDGSVTRLVASTDPEIKNGSDGT